MREFPNLLCDVSDSVLAVIDIQVRLTAAMPAKVLARLQRNMEMLMKSAAVLDVPVFASERSPAEVGAMEPDITALLPRSARRIEKTQFSLVDAKGFLEALRVSGRKQVILTGMEAHVCVQQTAVRLVQEGFQPFVVADAVCSRQRESYETALERMRQVGVTICDAESVLFEWLRDSRNPHFREIQDLMR